MLFCMARIAVITRMIEKTPTSTPSRVSPERSLCAAMEDSARLALSRNSMRKRFMGKCQEPRAKSQGGETQRPDVAPLGSRYLALGTSSSFLAQGLHRAETRRAPRGEK